MQVPATRAHRKIVSEVSLDHLYYSGVQEPVVCLTLETVVVPGTRKEGNERRQVCPGVVPGSQIRMLWIQTLAWGIYFLDQGYQVDQVDRGLPGSGRNSDPEEPWDGDQDVDESDDGEGRDGDQEQTGGAATPGSDSYVVTLPLDSDVVQVYSYSVVWPPLPHHQGVPHLHPWVPAGVEPLLDLVWQLQGIPVGVLSTVGSLSLP